MATVPVPIPAPVATILAPSAPAPASKPSFRQTFGNDVKKVWAWLSSPKVQNAVVAGEALGEGIADAINPALAGLNPVINGWTQEIFKSQALAAAAIAAGGTASGAEKAAMTVNSVIPQLTTFLEANHMPVPAGNELLKANTLLVQFLDTIFTAAPAPPAA